MVRQKARETGQGPESVLGADPGFPRRAALVSYHPTAN
jgi:hypothetical protein